jgi:DNA polymerase-3 subunit beta
MEIKVNSNELAKKLEQVTKVVATKSAIPILSDVLVETRGDVMLLTTSDSEVWLSVKCPLLGNFDGLKFCVNAHDLLELVKNLNDREVTISIDEESHQMLCDYVNGNFSMPYDNASEFPTPNTESENPSSVIVGGKNIMKAIELTSFAVGNSTIRPIMNGIHFVFSESGMTASATNMHKVAVYNDNSIKHGAHIEFTMPKKPSVILSSMLSSVDGDIKISFGASAVSINNTNFKLSARLIEGNFFDCESLTRVIRPINVTIDKVSILQALKRVMPMTNEMSNLVVMFFEQGQVTVTADNAVFGKSASETVKCDCDTELRIGFKCSDLIELFKNIDDDNIVMEMEDSMKGAVIYALSTYSREEYVSLIASSQIGQQQNG